MHLISLETARVRIRAQDGFTLLAVLGVMLVTSLLIVASFTAANGDVQLSQENTSHQQAFYAAVAGVQEYQYQLQNNPDYWESCEAPTGEEGGVLYEVKVLPATGASACNPASPFTTAIESKGKLANTFRVESVGCTGVSGLTNCQGPLTKTESKRAIVATFQVTGFLDYAYFTQYEDEDFNLNGDSQAECEQYYSVRSRGADNCTEIEFAPEDGVRGPMHTDDAANVCGAVEFGRKKQEPPDAVEINGGAISVCGGSAIYNTANGKPSVGSELRPPPSDTSLSFYVESQNRFEGVTTLTLNGSSNTITVVNKGNTESIPWPANGLIYIENEGACNPEYKQVAADLAHEAAKIKGCGTVYVNGTYSKSLTIAATRDVVINGNITPTGVTPGEAPTNTATLGLIATYYVRIYHPVLETYARPSRGCNSGDRETSPGVCSYKNEQNGCDAPNASGSLSNPWVYAAILSTAHSFLVDNYDCGSSSELGYLNMYGAIAQKFRGIVGTSGSTGYLKNYNYDERLATDEPPYFLAPLKAGWKIVRETAKSEG